jgi:hypothetical protein
LHAGAIAETPDGRLRALRNFYIPPALDQKTLSTLSTVLFPVVAGIAYNLRPDRPPQGYIQRFAFSDSLSSKTLSEFRVWARAKAAEFINETDQWLANNEQKAAIDNPASPIGEHAGLGVYYYEGPSIGNALKPTK